MTSLIEQVSFAQKGQSKSCKLMTWEQSKEIFNICSKMKNEIVDPFAQN